MKRVNLKQGTLLWDNARESRIGSSEIYDIVRYYASDEELQNCGINAEDFRREKPYTTAWALYHKMIGDGIYRREALAPEFAEYGHAVEPYGVRVLQKGRAKRLKPGVVYANKRLIASLDIEGIAEEVDIRPFDYGNGKPKIGQRFVCEQKSMMPNMVKNGVPFKYIVQAQYQIMSTGADFFILQIMVLKNDTVFNRGKICQMSPKKRYEYLDDNNMSVSHFYFRNNEHLAQLIRECLNRFFVDVDTLSEPKPFLDVDSTQNVIESIRLNALYNDKMVVEFDLTEYIRAKDAENRAAEVRKRLLQDIVDKAMEYNACRFKMADGTTALFAKNGSFRVTKPTEKAVGA